MDDIEIRIVDSAHRADVSLPNEPFRTTGRLLPRYGNGRWSWSEERFPEPIEMCFPEENYDYDALCAEGVCLGAYQDDRCVGLAILKDAWNRYLYLHDLKVCAAFRRRGVGALLIDGAMEVALARGYLGLFTIAQDNNLSACRFYLHSGFQLGGLDTRVYCGTAQAGKADLLLYRDHGDNPIHIRQEESSMKLTKGVHHIALKCTGIEAFEKTVGFYRDLLGMEVVRSWGEGEDCGIMLAIGGGSVMEIFASGGDARGQGAIRHFALATDDVDACTKACADAGYDVFVQPKDIVIGSEPPFPVRIAFVTGPVGEEIEFFCEK